MKLKNIALILLSICFPNARGLSLKMKDAPSATNNKPNIFFILVDDWVSNRYLTLNIRKRKSMLENELLFRQQGSYDMELCETKDIHTPNMKRLAREGVFLNNYYVAPLCTPSRASLMTGADVHRTGLQHYVIGNAQPMALPLNFTIMPQHMNKLGYTSRMIGKVR